jgi:signal transduction histidine kinase
VCQTLSAEYRTEAAHDGRAGLEKALRLVPDLVVTDMAMSGLSGEQLVQAIRNSPELDATAIMLLTARSDDATRVKLLREGAQDYLLKPFLADELRTRVSNLVAMMRTRQVLQSELGGQAHELESLARGVAQQKHELQADLEAARAAREQAEQNSRQKSGFLAMVAQELRTPLAALQLQLERLEARSSQELPYDKHVLLHRMANSVGRVHGLIDGLAQYARIDSGCFSVRTEPLNVAQMAAEVLEALRSRAEEKGLALRLHVDNDAVSDFEGDRALIRLILVHLVENGLKSAEQGQVRVSVGFDERSCRLTVFDSGPGIPREQQAGMFQPLEPGELSRRANQLAVSMGLSLVRQMVDVLGGSITLTTRAGHGTKYSVRLPYRTGSVFESPLHASA